MMSTKPRGRPPKPEEERMIQRSVRLPPPLWDKIDKGGMEWFRKLIKRARLPE